MLSKMPSVLGTSSFFLIAILDSFSLEGREEKGREEVREKNKVEVRLPYYSHSFAIKNWPKSSVKHIK